jgi:hypothetical protein
MLALLIIGGWFVGGLLFILWDSLIGLGVEFDGYENPPLLLVAAFWPIAIPCLLFYNFIRLCDFLKEEREDRQKQKRKAEEKKRVEAEKLRVAAEKEFEASMAQVEAEMRTYSEATSKNKA